MKLIHGRQVAGLMLVLLLGVVAPLVRAEADMAHPVPSAGLMWNKTGLPAVFPLQVKTLPGQDYFLTLSDDETGAAALAAYIKGGDFFKILVPPGSYRLRFAAGNIWQGEDALFGPGEKTDVFELRDPLVFETRGLGVKAGHIVNLRNRKPGQFAEATLSDQLICQSFRPGFPRRIESAQAGVREWDRQQHGLYETQPKDLPGVSGDFPGKTRPFEPTSYAYTVPRQDVRSRYCG